MYTDIAKNEHISKKGTSWASWTAAMRTIKKMINDHIDDTGDLKWDTWLTNIISDYNKTGLPIGLQNQSPDEVFDAPEISLVQKHTMEQEENMRRLGKTSKRFSTNQETRCAS